MTVCAVNTADKVLGVAASNVTANGPTTDVFVYDDPNQEFIIQCDDATILADLQHRVFDIDGNNAAVVTGTTISAVKLDASTGAIDRTLNPAKLEFMRLYESIGNAFNVANQLVVVKINPNCHYAVGATI